VQKTEQITQTDSQTKLDSFANKLATSLNSFKKNSKRKLS